MGSGPTDDLVTPTVYLVRRGLTSEQIERLRSYLSITPVGAVLITDLGDIEYARQISEEKPTVLSRPIVIVGDFDHDFAELARKTTWQNLPITSETTTENIGRS